MALRDDIQKRIDKKRAEIAALETQLRDTTVYVQALEDTLRMLPRDTDDGSAPVSNGNLRPGSKVDKAREAIRSQGRPLHVVELLKSIGTPNNARNRAALAGSLGAYARKCEIFSRPAPNTFGLLELRAKISGNGPPPNFGIDDPGEGLASAARSSDALDERLD